MNVDTQEVSGASVCLESQGHGSLSLQLFAGNWIQRECACCEYGAFLDVNEAVCVLIRSGVDIKCLINEFLARSNC